MPRSDSNEGTRPADADYALDWLSEPERLLDRARAEPDALEAYFHGLDAAHAFTATSLVDSEALHLAVAALGTRQLIASTGFDFPDIARHIDWDAAEVAQVQAEVRVEPFGSRPIGLPSLIYVPGREAMTWDLPDVIANALTDKSEDRVLVIATPATPERPLRRACKAFAMTGLETRVTEATLKAGSIRDGALAARVSYATAREATSSALAKVGARRLPGLLHSLSLLAFGIFQTGEEAPAILVDRWGLKPRQAQIAMLLAQGLTRAETARAMEISEATVKKQADILFQILGVSGAAEMVRLISVATVMQALTSASHGRIGWIDGSSEPLRFVHAAGGRRIAVSEYGRPKGRPVVILHSSMTTRHPPRQLVARLVSEDYRVITIDRPGFGLTDPSEPAAGTVGQDIFADAAHDMALVLDKLRIDRIDVIGRGGAQAAVAFAGLYPDRCGKVVLVNPDPISSRDERRWGVLGSFKEAYQRRPGLILPAARLIARAMTRDYLGKVLLKSMRGSPPDEALLADDDVVDDYYRAVRMFATGRLEGYVREQLYFARGKTFEYPVDGSGWSILIGGHDTLSDPANALAYWRELLPRGEFEILPDHGRLLAYADPDLIVSRLRS